MIVEGRASRLASCDFDKKESCVRCARDDIVLRLRVAPSIHHYCHLTSGGYCCSIDPGLMSDIRNKSEEKHS